MNWLRFLAKAGVHAAMGLGGEVRRTRGRLRGRLVVLTYHSFCDSWPQGLVSSLPIARFEQQLVHLKREFEVVSLSTGLSCLYEGRYSEKPWVVITIDDGFSDNYTHAFPVLKRLGVPATIFLATDFLDSGRAPWPTRIAVLLERARRPQMEFPFVASLRTRSRRAAVLRQLMDAWGGEAPGARSLAIDSLARHLNVREDGPIHPLSWSQVREMRGAGIDFGSHTVFHSRLHESAGAVVDAELVDSKGRIERELDAPCDYFAYPDGKWNAAARQAVGRAGYRAALTQDFGSNSPHGCDLLALRRVEVPFHDPLPTFRWRVASSANASETVP